jgi:c-di-GMP-binding flagellar brake protein YcgR
MTVSRRDKSGRASADPRPASHPRVVEAVAVESRPAPESPRGAKPVSAVRDRRRREEERRNTGRIATTFAVSEREGTAVHLCQAEDIAIGGMTIKHAKGLMHEPRTEVSLRFSLPGSNEEIEARGEIVSDARAGRFRRTGVRFIAVRPEHQRLIAAYCLRR